jgi:hypothetical protein
MGTHREVRAHFVCAARQRWLLLLIRHLRA